MTIDEFLAFTDTRPEEERWELIEGVAVLNPSPIDHHQIVVSNIVAFLVRAKIETNAPWLPLIGNRDTSSGFHPQPSATGCDGEGARSNGFCCLRGWACDF